jgi:transcriptional regulator with XRE-family HTH domain
MSPSRFADLKRVRRTLGVSQSKLAELLGTSIRAVQSYEQGWRNVPDHVQRSTALLTYLHNRKSTKPPKPCWEVRRCDSEIRDACSVYELQAGDLCWLIPGRCCPDNGEASLATCEGCQVMKAWL